MVMEVNIHSRIVGQVLIPLLSWIPTGSRSQIDDRVAGKLLGMWQIELSGIATFTEEEANK